MNAERTASGLSNEYLFHDGEAVVYVEGGTGTARSGSADLIFWRKLFEKFAPERKFYFKSRGGKTTLLRIADKVAAGRLCNVIVCLDRDFDHIMPKEPCNHILYTYGYSWENDVWSAEVVEEAFFSLCGVDRRDAVVRARIDASLAGLHRELRWIVYADMVALSRCRLAVIPRDNFRCVEPPQRGWPRVNVSYLRERVRDTNRRRTERPWRLLVRQSVVVERDLYGHLFGHFCYRMLRHLIHEYCGTPTGKDVAERFAILLSLERLSGPIRLHYEAQFGSLLEGSIGYAGALG